MMRSKGRFSLLLILATIANTGYCDNFKVLFIPSGYSQATCTQAITGSASDTKAPNNNLQLPHTADSGVGWKLLRLTNFKFNTKGKKCPDFPVFSQPNCSKNGIMYSLSIPCTFTRSNSQFTFTAVTNQGSLAAQCAPSNNAFVVQGNSISSARKSCSNSY